MKKIETVIRPETFQPLRGRLNDLGINGLTVSEVAGCGKQKGLEGIFRGNRYEIKLYPKVKVEMILEDLLVDQVIDTIIDICYTGEAGDGKIFIIPVEDVVRIRTRERGKTAIS